MIITTDIVGSELLKTPKITGKHFFSAQKVPNFSPPAAGKTMSKNTLNPQNYTRDLGFWTDGARADAERKLEYERPNLESPNTFLEHRNAQRVRTEYPCVAPFSLRGECNS